MPVGKKPSPGLENLFLTKNKLLWTTQNQCARRSPKGRELEKDIERNLKELGF